MQTSPRRVGNELAAWHQPHFSRLFTFRQTNAFHEGSAKENAEWMTALTEHEEDRIIEMAWEDRTPFEAIKAQFGLSQGEVEKLMRHSLKSSSFKRWRKRVSSGVGVKHARKASPNMQRFKCFRQRSISMNRISKRRV